VFLRRWRRGIWSITSGQLGGPWFAPPEIGGKRYVDGGSGTHIPYAMADAVATADIVVDISGSGFNRSRTSPGAKTVYIKNSIEMGGLLDFDRDFLDAYTELGYLDSMRAFGQAEGLFVLHRAGRRGRAPVPPAPEREAPWGSRRSLKRCATTGTSI
jgi:predicted acylesterase/phospholipase RssA